MIGPRKVDKPLVLYGYGNLGRLAEEIFDELKIPVHMIIDNALPTYFVLDRLDGQPLPRDQVLVAVCVAKEPYYETASRLEVCGFKDIVPVWDIIEAYPEVGLRNGWFAGTITPEDRQGIRNVMVRWSDFNSLAYYMSFIAWRKFRQEWRTVPFGSDKYDAPDLPSKLAEIRERQYPTKQYLMDENGNVDLHCEGFELETLKDNITDIRKKRPIVRISCYHSRDGLWRIPDYMMDHLQGYRFIFRLFAYMGQAAYLFCVPEERL